MDWTVCPPSASGVCPPGMKLAMINRGGAKASPTSCQISFSADSVSWSRQASTDNGQLVVGTHHGKPGLVAVAAGDSGSGAALLSSQQIALCPLGLRMNNTDLSCGTPGSANYTQRKPSDVIGHGMGLLISKDGVHWKLFKKLWPFGGMYTTMAALETDKVPSLGYVTRARSEWLSKLSLSLSLSLSLTHTHTHTHTQFVSSLDV